jgi:hypothetical protein
VVYGDLSNRRFQPYTEPPCPSCHKVPSGRSRMRISPEMHELSRYLMGQSTSPGAGNSAQRGPLSTGIAVHFSAMRIKGPKSIVQATLRWDRQDFRSVATPWEKVHSPLVRSNAGGPIGIGKPFHPVVDQQGAVVAYMAVRIKPYEIRVEPGGKEMSYAGRPPLTSKGVLDLSHRFSGGDNADVLVDINGRVLSVRVYDRALQPPDLLPGLLLALVGSAGSILFGLTKQGIRTLIVRGGLRLTRSSAARAGSKIPLALRPSGKYATGSQSIRLYKGVGEDGLALLKKNPGAFKWLSRGDEDFVEGLYASMDPAVAKAFVRGRGALLEAKIDLRDLGRIVDVRHGGLHRAAYEQFMRTPDRFGVVRAALVEKNAALRAKYFQEFLAKHHPDAQSVIGPIGDAWTAGPKLPAGLLSEQIAIRDAAIVAHVAKLLAKSPATNLGAKAAAGAALGGMTAAPGSSGGGSSGQ